MAYIETVEMTNIDKLTRSCRPPKMTIAVEMKIRRCRINGVSLKTCVPINCSGRFRRRTNCVSLTNFDVFDNANPLGHHCTKFRLHHEQEPFGLYCFQVDCDGGIVAQDLFRPHKPPAQRALCAKRFLGGPRLKSVWAEGECWRGSPFWHFP